MKASVFLAGLLAVKLQTVSGTPAELPCRAFPLSQVRLLAGPFKERQELHRTGLVGGLDPERLLYGFRTNAGLPQPSGVTGGYGGWDNEFIAGHYAGHYLSAASRMYAATGDESFRERAGHMAKAMALCQAKLGGGYLSAFPEGWFNQLESDPHKASVPYYTIHKILMGLLDVHLWCGDPEALATASRMSDYFAARFARLTPAQVEAMLRTDYTANPVNEFGAMAEALSELYTLAERAGQTNAVRHLKLAGVFNRAWLVEPLLKGEDKLEGLHGNTHVAQAVGLARYSLAAGDERTGRAAHAFWSLVTSQHSFAIGGNSFDEKLRAAGTEVSGQGVAALSAKTAETCNTHNLLKLTRNLFERDPLARYMDYYEMALYNHILASIAPDSGRVTYFTPLRPGDFRTYLDKPYCCQGTGIENTARFGEAIYFHRAHELWVNLFIPSTLDWKERGLKVRLETDYPESGLIRLHLDAPEPVETTIHLRVPTWIEGRIALAVKGKVQSGLTPSAGYVSVSRRWHKGDTIELRLPLRLRTRPAMDDPGTVSFFYGPVILAGELGCAGMPPSDVGGKDDYVNLPTVPVPTLVGTKQAKTSRSIRRMAGSPLTFRARMTDPSNGKEDYVRLVPLYRVHHERFAVYWRYPVVAKDLATH